MVKVDALSDGGAAATPLVLASASVARAAILRAAGLQFEIRAASVDEAEIKNAMRANDPDGGATAQALALAKARRVSAQVPGTLVIGADQLLTCDGEWFDKPSDRDAASAQLRRLRGRSHQLVTAVTVMQDDAEVWTTLARPTLTMRVFSDAFLDDYLEQAGDAVLTSVGGYQLEGLGAQLFAEIEGDWFSILGLPLMPLLDFLREQGIVQT
jgi:septum formation protein